MNSKLLLTSTLMSLAFGGFAQKASNKAFAITGDGNNDYLWMNIRQVDLGTGTVEKTLFQKNTTKFTITDINSKSVIDATATADGNIYNSSNYPTGTFVAAAAFDQKSGNLYFMPLRVGELRWVNVNGTEANKFYSVKTAFVQPKTDLLDEGGNITRMAIASNNKGYAISNDGNTVLEFTTGKTPSITNLGSLIDSDVNGAISVHNKCTSWGGDMVADANGNLWIISASRNVFMIDMKTKVAAYKGSITGLPGTFTTNGAAVDEDGNLIVTSAISFEGYYKVGIKTLNATKIEGSDVKYNASDLAGSNMLFQKEKDAAFKATGSSELTALSVDGNTKVFPNPLTGNSFKIQLDNANEGVVNVMLTDLSGRALQVNKIAVTKGQKVISVNLANRPAKGSYLIKVINEKQEIILTDKMLVL